MKKSVSVQRLVQVSLAVCLLGAPVFASAGDELPPRVVVTGEGSSDIAPDMAVLNLSVAREAATAREALTANSAAMEKVLTALEGLGIAKRDIQTSNFDIQPRYAYPSRQGNGANEPPKLVGYTVRNALAVRIRDISRVGEVLDKSVTLGVNEGGNIFFTNDDPSAALTAARKQAVQDAMAKATTLADAAGVKLGRVLEMAENSYNSRPIPMAKMEMAMDRGVGASVPIAAGENTYQVTVNMTLELAQ